MLPGRILSRKEQFWRSLVGVLVMFVLMLTAIGVIAHAAAATTVKVIYSIVAEFTADQSD